MKITRNALLRVCLLACVPIASMAQVPVIVEAESGSRGVSLTTGTDATAGVNYITVISTANSGATPTPDRVATYQVTFPAAGSYALYVRIYVGPIGGADDSFYVPSGFNNATNWTGLYNTSTGGASAPGAGVSTTGGAGQNVWKWVRLTSIPGIGDTSVGPTAWVVPDGALTQTFAWGSREDGLLFDKLAFGYRCRMAGTATGEKGTYFGCECRIDVLAEVDVTSPIGRAQEGRAHIAVSCIVEQQLKPHPEGERLVPRKIHLESESHLYGMHQAFDRYPEAM